MKHLKQAGYCWIGILLVCGAALAEEALEKPVENSRHRIGVQVPFWVRATGKFTGFQMSEYGSNNGVGTVDRTYVDGYNKVDVTGNEISPLPPARYSFHRTSNFKFDSLTQVMNDPDPTDSEAVDPNGGTLSLHSIAISGGEFAKDRNTDLLPGVELFYRYELLQRNKWSLDLELGAAWQQFEWEINSPINGTVDVITDVYPLGGVILRNSHAGQEGVFDDVTGRKPVIGSVPQRSAPQTSGIIVGNHELNMDAAMLRLGPAFSWKPSNRWNFDLLGGLSLVLARTEYRYVNRAVNDVIVNGIPLPVPSQTGETSDSSATFGFYSALRATFRLTSKWDAQAEVRHLWQDPVRLSAPLGSGEVNLSDGLAIVIGIGRRF